MRRTLYFAIIGVLLLCVLVTAAHAATITVTNTNDSGPGSLRQALSDANDGDTIAFAVTGAIVLTSGGLVIDKNVTISGPGADRLSIDGNQAEAQCVFGVAHYNAVTISGLTVTKGGCGIYCDHAWLTVNNCAVTNNGSYFGIGINDVFGPSSRIQPENEGRNENKNYSDQPLGPHSLTIANSIISGNSGPGVHNVAAVVTIDKTTITGNSTGQDYGYGGGIDTGGGKLPGNVTVSNSTISGNSAFYEGGGIYCGFSGLTVVNSTISNNAAGDFGGGILSGFGSSITNSTLSGNSDGSGGGIYNGGTLEVYCTILNAGASGENIFNQGGMVASQGYNISSDNGSGLLTGPGDQINTDPLLGPLRNHGGPTLTHMPFRGSPAIDAGDPEFAPPPDHDQRGSCFYRVFGPRIDVGSVETQLRPRCVTPAPRPRP